MKSLGIDIGSSGVRVVEVTSTTKSTQITRVFKYQFSGSPGQDIHLETLEFLRNIASQYDPASTKVVFGLRQDRVSLRNKVFPFQDRLKIFKSLPFELEEDLPFNSETSIFDAKHICHHGSSTEVLACASPKHQIQAALDLIKDTGFVVSILSAEGIALANCIENWNEAIPDLPPSPIELEGSDRPTRPMKVLLHIGHSRTLACAFDENLRLIGIRSALWGGKNVAEIISRRYEIPMVEALKESQNKAFVLLNKDGASYDQIVFSDLIYSSLKELSRDVKLTLLEFKSEFNGIVSEIYVSGGGSNIQNIGPALTMLLDTPVNTRELTTHMQNVASDVDAQFDRTMAVALGLAIEGLKKPRNPAVNFLKNEFAKQNDAVKKMWEKWGSVVKTAAAAYVIFFVYSNIRSSFADSLKDKSEVYLKAQAKIEAQLSGKAASESNLKKYIKNQKKYITEMKSISDLGQMTSALEILKKISDSTPSRSQVNMQVTNFSVTDSTVQISGAVDSQEKLSSLLENLKRVAINGKVNSNPGLGTPPKGIPFSYTFEVDRGIKR